MGALHAGHARSSTQRAHRVRHRRDEPLREPGAVRDQGDLERYPRDEQRDLEVAQEAGVDIVFAPSADEMLPPGFQTWVEVTELGSILEGGSARATSEE